MQLKELFNFFTNTSLHTKKQNIKLVLPLIKRILPVIETYLQSTNIRKMQTNSSISTITQNTAHTSFYTILQHYFNNQIYKTKQVNLIEDLRYIILDTLKHSPKNVHNVLEYYHSVIHLVYFVNKRGMKLTAKLREWLNTNYKSDSLEIDLIRGDFDKIVLTYPDLCEALEEFDQGFNDAKEIMVDDDVTMHNIDNKEIQVTNAEKHNRWKNKYIAVFPKKFKKILTGTYDDKCLFWGDKLIYQLLFVKKEKEYNNEDLRDMILTDNIYADLLTGNYKEAFYKGDKLLQIILLFVLPIEGIEDLIPIVESLLVDLGRSVSEYDTLFSLHIFKFTSRLNYFYSYIVSNIQMSDRIGKYLFQFALDNNLDTKIILKRWMQFNIDNKNYSMLFSMFREYSLDQVSVNFNDRDAVNFCLSNYNEFCSVFTKNVVKPKQKEFIDVLYKITNNIDIDKNEIEHFLDNEISIHFLDLVIPKVCQLNDVSNEFLLKMMNIVVVAEKHGMDVKPYKQIVLESFYNK